VSFQRRGEVDVDLNSGLSFIVPILIVAGLTFLVIRSGRKIRTMVCTRCEGSGQVDERWPDPSAPGGWHVVSGTCPKCKGAGKV